MNPNHARFLAVLAAASMLMILFSQSVSAAPVTTLTVSEPKYGDSPMYVNILTEFTLTATEAADVWYRWDSHPYSRYTAPFNAVVYMPSTGGAPPLEIDLEDGLHTLYYNATGEAPKSLDIILDNLYPSTGYQFNGPYFPGENPYIKSTTQMGLSASDDGSGVATIRYALNNDPFQVYTTPFTMHGTGMQAIYFYAVDNLGNEEPLQSLSVLIDDAPPVVSINLGSMHIEVSGTTFISLSTPVSLDLLDTSGIASASYRIDAGPWAPYTEPFTVPMQGLRTITARATDNLGHASEEVSITVHVDSSAPTVSVVGVSGESVRLKPGATLEFLCSDVGVGGCVISYSFDNGASWFEYTEPFSVEQSVNITYFAADAVGNAASQQTLRVTVSESRDIPWRTYLGYGLIVAGILVAISTFFIGRKPDRGEDSEKPKRVRRKRNW